MHQLATTVFRRCLLLVLLVGSLGACQRAGYQLQPVASAANQVAAPVSMSESAVVTMAALPAAKPGESHQPVPHRAHRLLRARLPRLTRVRVAAASMLRPAVAAARVAPMRQRQEPGPVAKPVRYRSRGIAILLAALSLTYLPLSLHNFYLGYYGRGALAIALVITGTYLVVLGFFAGLFAGTGLTGLGLVGLAMLGGWFVWQITDLVRIITKDLKPKNGEYTPRFFQTKPDASNAPRPD